nr:nitrous oxide reductase accessory protein NosL [Halomicroarcula sp. DFY41]
MATNFPDWNAQAVHDDNTRAFFCTSGCATTYYAVPDQFAATDADITGLWIRDLNSRELIDGTAAYYALETDGDRLDDPMQVNPAPFAAREDAVSYVDEVDYLTEDDIVELTAFDGELAEQYRGQLVE